MKKQARRVGRTHAIVPVNILGKSKARLSKLLSPAEREQLTVAMLKDVLTALSRARLVDGAIVVSADQTVRRISRGFGAGFLWEGKRRGLNNAVRMAIHASQRKGVKKILVIHADLPLLKPRDVDVFLRRCASSSLALGPSRDGSGTNALFMNPPNIIDPLFGTNSFSRHMSVAKQMNEPVRIIRLKAIGFDIDEPQDLVQLMRRPIQNETGQFLKTLRDERAAAR